LISAFPQLLQEKYREAMYQHPLKAEIIATKLANNIGNDMGFNFVHRMCDETGASVAEVANCYAIASALFELPEYFRKIEALDNKISAAVQIEMLFQIRRTVRRVTRWFLRHRNKSLSIEQSIAYFKPTFDDMCNNLGKYMTEKEMAPLLHVETDLVNSGVPKDIAKRISYLSTLFSVMDIAELVDSDKRSNAFVAETYFKLGERLELHWFLDQITRQAVNNHWQALARASFREELDWQQRAITAVVLRSNPEEKNVDKLFEQWFECNEAPLSRWLQVLSEFRTTPNHEYAQFSVALRELMLLSLNCDPLK
jgi:glutamate dehydrogenase